jgi:aspartate/methionine/tyrosine aminotransferase
MKIKPFGVEMWMNEYENHCQYNLAETCVESLTIAELLAICGKSEDSLKDLLSMKQTYGEIEGSIALREQISGLFKNQSVSNVLIAHGAIGANALVYATLVEPGDHVVSIVPSYQQHYSIPESYGAEVKKLLLTEQDQFLPDLQQLEELITDKTKLISLCNPNNPTGALIDEETLKKIVAIARQHDAWILCDEVYRGTNQQGDGFTASIADLYEKGISTGSMSKAFSLAGLRLGWIVACESLMQKVTHQRDYNTISVGMIDDYFATMALTHRHRILARSHKITRENLATLDNWVNGEEKIHYVKPASGTIALLRYDAKISSRDFCVQLLQSTGVLFTPGSALDMEGWVRIGYANTPSIVQQGLPKVSSFLQSLS